VNIYKCLTIIIVTKKCPKKILAFLTQFNGMLEIIGLSRRNHTHAAQAQDGRKEEGAENCVSHGVIKAP